MAHSELSQTKRFAQVVLDVSVGRPLEYAIPAELQPKLQKGVHVKVPLRGHLRSGYVLSISDTPSFSKSLPIHSIEDETPQLTPVLFELALWMSRYYCVHLGAILKSMLPSCLRGKVQPKEQKWVVRAQTRAELQSLCADLQRSHPAQAKVLEALLPASKGLLLTELLQKAGVSRSPIDTLEKQGALKLTTIQIERSPLVGETYFKTFPKKLNQEQKEALDKIENSLEKEEFETHLLFGVTGSGKTEVYLQAIEKCVAKGKQALMLVPEISLTAQTIERFKSRLDYPIAILHHRLSEGERFDEWQKIRRGDVSIVIGARSALFSPLPNLGLILIDEEHDGAYKQQEEAFCYHARDVAVVLGKMTKATVVLGSATPSIESYHNSLNQKYTLSKLTQRPGAQLPDVKLIDMRREWERNKGFTLFSEELVDKLKERIERGEQAILFLNRRGYHSSQQCESCGEILQCPHCELALTFYKGENRLCCHLCEYSMPPPQACPKCQTRQEWKFKGVGTELVERSLNALLPEARTLRIDGDTTRHKGSHDQLFQKFRTQKADILIGTQMIAKGLHFPAVTLVSVLNADGTLHLPDFRAGEHLFQLITQVSGRAGRGEIKGEVLIQTHLPENSTLLLSSKGDYTAFYDQEIEVRETFGYPPYTHFVKVHVSSPESTEAEQMANALRRACHGRIDGGSVHPVVPSGYPKIKDRFRFHFLIRHVNPYAITSHLQGILSKVKPKKGLRIQIDVDPLSTFF
jgi:primosomal protein N' (replication factor Y) (superfamily II helicase)